MKNDETGKPEPLKDRTKDFAPPIIRMYSSLSKSSVAQVLGKQIRRSGTSFGAIDREANRTRSKSEFIARRGDSLKELDETCHWLDLLSESGSVTKRLKILLDEPGQLMAIFITIIKRAKAPAAC